jgi:hypothetical protein
MIVPNRTLGAEMSKVAPPAGNLSDAPADRCDHRMCASDHIDENTGSPFRLIELAPAD